MTRDAAPTATTGAIRRPAGAYEITAAASQGIAVASAVVEGGRTSRLEVKLVRFGTVQGRVLLSGIESNTVDVVALGPDERMHPNGTWGAGVVKMTEKGGFTVDLIPGVWTIRTSASGNHVTKEVTVRSGEVTDMGTMLLAGDD